MSKTYKYSGLTEELHRRLVSEHVGPNQPSPANNYRPELHDSNGLSIHAGNGEWIWRPYSEDASGITAK